jgi:hypothetical protein
VAKGEDGKPMNDNHIRFVPMSTVDVALARALGSAPLAVTPDDIATIAGSIEWRPTAGWDADEDSMVASNAGLFDVRFEGDTLLVVEASFAPDRGAFLIDGADLERFVSEHLERYGAVFFDGDVIIVEAHGSQVWLFHHEGVYAYRS